MTIKSSSNGIFFDKALIVFFFTVALKPGDQFSQVSKSLLMEVQSRTLYFYQLFDWFFVTIHVNEKEVLWILWTASKIVMNQRGFFTHL